MDKHFRKGLYQRLGMVWLGFGLTWGLPAQAQAQTSAEARPTIPPPQTLPAQAASRESQLDARIRDLEATIKAGAEREARLEERLLRLEAGQPRPTTGTAPGTPPPSMPEGLGPSVSTSLEALAGDMLAEPGPSVGISPGAGAVGPPAAAAAASSTSSSLGGEAAPRGPFAPAPTGRFNMPTVFAPLFMLESKDSEFQLQFHDLTQTEGRFLGTGNQEPVNSTFLINRQWFMFSGRLTKPYEYFVSWAQGLDTITPLDVWLNVHYDDRLQFKLGRMFTPFAYEWWNVPTNATICPERSLFYNNFGPGRDTGAMAWGTLYDNRIGYAVGIFNGYRNGIIDTNDFKDVVATMNFRPFGLWQDSWLENFNIGGSVSAGKEDNVATPQVFRTSVAFSGNFDVGPEFFAFNNNVREFGYRALWDLHAAYYYRQLSLIAEWQSGFENYGLATNASVATSPTQLHTNPLTRVRVPIQSYYVQAGYFVTGETVSSRGVVKPLRNFDLRPGKFGLGAFELAARYNPLNFGNQVFKAGLSDPNLWTNNLYTIDLGVNWYWTEYIKVQLFWEYACFGNPVTYAPDRFQTRSNEAIIRFQIYF
jgi:phosphate-selective porin OprO/OprP